MLASSLLPTSSWTAASPLSCRQTDDLARRACSHEQDASGLARRFQYQSGLRSDPAFEANTRYLSPSARYIIGAIRVCPAAADGVEQQQWRTGAVAADSPVVGAELGDCVLVELLSRASQRPSSRLPG